MTGSAGPAPLSPHPGLLRTGRRRGPGTLRHALPSLVLTIPPCVYKQKESCSVGCNPVMSPGALRTKMGIFPCVLTRELCKCSYFNHLTQTE